MKLPRNTFAKLKKNINFLEIINDLSNDKIQSLLKICPQFYIQTLQDCLINIRYNSSLINSNTKKFIQDKLISHSSIIDDMIKTKSLPKLKMLFIENISVIKPVVEFIVPIIKLLLEQNKHDV